jgi:hypothetical protein
MFYRRLESRRKSKKAATVQRAELPAGAFRANTPLTLKTGDFAPDRVSLSEAQKVTYIVLRPKQQINKGTVSDIEGE